VTTLLTPHFSLEELGGVGPIAPEHRINLGRLAVLLEAFRSATGGVPYTVTSAYRAPERNELVGGVPHSQHLDGSAADILPKGLSHREFHSRVLNAESRGKIPDYGQLIYYPFSLVGASWGHIHISLANRDKRRQKLVRVNEKSTEYAGVKYVPVSADILGRFPTPGSSTVILAALIAGAAVLSWLSSSPRHS
jgi:hypothetical protein